MATITRKVTMVLGVTAATSAALLLPLAGAAHAANDTPDDYSYGMAYGYAIWDDGVKEGCSGRHYFRE